MNSKKSFTLKDFMDLDSSSNIDFLIASMEAHYNLENMRNIKKIAIEMLQLNHGEKVIELGCGLGHDAEALAEIVGNTGSVIAMDSSKRMISEAQKRSTHPNVTYLYGDANNLAFADNSFSACRADRLLVSQKNVDQVFLEAMRVVKPEGKICITALDFGALTLSPNLGNTTDIIINYWQQLVENPFIGRELPGVFKQHGLLNVNFIPHVFTIDKYQDLQEIVQFDTMLNDMVYHGLISEIQKEETILAFQHADEADEFLWSINLVTVMGTKPIAHNATQKHHNINTSELAVA